MAREIIHEGLHNAPFVERATEGFDAYAASVEPFTLAEGERLTGVPADVIRETAHAYARADRAMICWTLGITEHHNAVDNVLALINLGLLCGHVGRYGSGLNPLRGQNNVQGGGDMGAIPNKLPGFQDIEHDADARARFEAAWGTPIRPAVRMAPHADVPRDGARRAPDALRDRREPGPVGGRRQPREEAARRARPPGRAGHRDDEDRGDGRRRAPRDGVVVRGGRDRDEQRAARAARAQGARPAGGGARRHVDHRGAGAAPRPRLGPPDRGGDLGRVPLALADASRDGLRPARGAPRAPVALPRRRAPGVALPPRAAVGRSRRGAARAVQRRRGKAALRGARRRLPDPAHDRAAPRVLQHGRAVEPVPLAAPPRRVPRPLARGRGASRGLRGRGRARVVAARRGRGSGADRPVPSGGAGVHDLPLPRRGRREPAHHRRHRPEVRHRGVQGRRDPRREAGARCRVHERADARETAPA